MKSITNLAALPSTPRIELLYRAHRLIQLYHSHYEMADMRVTDAFTRSLEVDTVCQQRNVDNPAIDFASRSIARAHEVIAEAVQNYQDELATASRRAAYSASKAARETLCSLAVDGTCIHTDLVLLSVTTNTGAVSNELIMGLQLTLAEALLTVGMPNDAISFVSYDANERTLTAHLTPHPRLPELLQDVCEKAQSVGSGVLDVDVFHAPYWVTHSLKNAMDFLTQVDLRAMETAFEEWCHNNDVVINVEVTEPDIFS